VNLTVTQLRVIDGACGVAAVADVGWLAYALLKPRVSLTFDGGHPATFSPMSAPPEWLLLLALAAFVALFVVSMCVLDPAIGRAKAANRRREGR
jgi:hypothetical protein